VTYDTPLQGIFFTASARLSKEEAMQKKLTRTFWRKLLMLPVGIPDVKLRTKFKVSSLNSFEDILDCLPENLVVT